MLTNNVLSKIIIFFLLIVPQGLYSQNLSVIDLEVLNRNKKLKDVEENMTSKLIDYLIVKSDSIIKINYWPRVTNKKLTAVSEDIHDYVSMATYYWSNPNTESGLPYIGRDGVSNPEVAKINNYSNLVQVSKRVKALGLAYFYTENEKYAKKAVSLIKVFFLQENTKMNPNFEHAQYIKGLNEGRLVGIIEARFFIDLLQGVELIKTSNYFSDYYYKNTQKWFKDFLEWMENSNMGKKHTTLKNNIETSYHLQRIAYASFIGNSRKIREIYQTSLKPLMRRQFTNNGKQPLELKRAKPEQYSLANLKYWYDIRNILRNNGVLFEKEEQDILDKGLRYLFSLDLTRLNVNHDRILKTILIQNEEIESNKISNNMIDNKMMKLTLDDLLIRLSY